MRKEQFGRRRDRLQQLFYNVAGDQLSEIREATTYTGPSDTDGSAVRSSINYSASCWGMWRRQRQQGGWVQQRQSEEAGVYIRSSDTSRSSMTMIIESLQSAAETRTVASINLATAVQL